MTARSYASTDASAPSLTGLAATPASSLVNLLNAVLVTGYGSKSPAGWTMPGAMVGTNTAAFLQGSGTVNPVYLWVDDAAASCSRVRGYETMSASSTGTGPCPTEAQSAGGAYMMRSNSSDATARPWWAVADERTLTLAVNIGIGNSECWFLHFGDLSAYSASDAYAKILITGIGSSYSQNAFSSMASGLTVVGNGHWLMRSYTQIGSAVTAGKHTDYVKYNGLVYPNPVDGGLYLGKMCVHENTAGVPRGDLRGVFVPLHTPAQVLPQGDTFSGTGTLAGKSFVAVRAYSSKQFMLETSNTWAA